VVLHPEDAHRPAEGSAVPDARGGVAEVSLICEISVIQVRDQDTMVAAWRCVSLPITVLR
jgi:hypothetical protein